MRKAKLTEWEQQTLKHLQSAQALGISVREYAKRRGVAVQGLYNGKFQLVRKGVMAGRAQTAAAQEKPGAFVGVRIAPTPGATATAAACRIRHPSGWVIECASWPEASWMAALFAGGTHAVAQ
jgi:predicted phage tail protein